MTIEARFDGRIGGFNLAARLSIAEQGVTALFGKSGSGKTLFLRCLAGLTRLRDGHLSVNGTVWQDERCFWPTHKRPIGYVFQEACLFDHLSVRANLAYAKNRNRDGDGPSLGDISDLLGLQRLLDRSTDGLSGGERQRVAIGRALLSGPRLLLMDEPLAALDGASKEEIIPYLETLHRTLTLPVVYVSHALSEITGLADHMAIMDQGAIVASGSIFDIMTRLDLFPMTGRFEAGAVILGRVAQHHGNDGLSAVDFDGGRLWIADLSTPVGETLRLRVRARDVMLALGEPQDISANNVVRCRVCDLRADGGPHVDVQLVCGATRLLSRITEKSRARLRLEKNTEVFAVIKSVTVERHSAREKKGRRLVSDGV